MGPSVWWTHYCRGLIDVAGPWLSWLPGPALCLLLAAEPWRILHYCLLTNDQSQLLRRVVTGLGLMGLVFTYWYLEPVPNMAGTGSRVS